jgi:hypothetical protein
MPLRYANSHPLNTHRYRYQLTNASCIRCKCARTLFNTHHYQLHRTSYIVLNSISLQGRLAGVPSQRIGLQMRRAGNHSSIVFMASLRTS